MARQDRWYPLGNSVLIDKSQFDDDEYSGANLRGMPATYNVGYRAASPDEVTGLWNEFQGTTRQQRDESGGKFGGVDPRLLQEGLTWQQAAQLYPDAYKASFNFDPSTNIFGGITSAAHSTDSTSLGDVAKAALGVYGGGLLLGSGLAALQGVPMWGAPAGAAAGATGTGAAGGAVTTPLSSANLAPAGTPLGALKADGTLAASIPVKTALATGGAGGVPVTELGRQAGFLDTLRNVGPGQTIANSLGGGGSGAGGLGQLLAGGGTGSGLLNIGGQLLGGLAGVYAADKAGDRAQDLANQQLGLYDRQLAAEEARWREQMNLINQQRQDRLPFLNKATGWLNDPMAYGEDPINQMLAKQTGRAIGGTRGENLFDNPTGQSLVMQSLAPQYYNAVGQFGNLGLGYPTPLQNVNYPSSSGLLTAGMNAAELAGAPWAVAGNTLGKIFNPAANRLRLV